MGTCVLLGALLAVASVYWLVLLGLAVARQGTRELGSGPLALAGLLALADIALVGNLGRWWLRPRWPGRQPRGWWPGWTDPLRRTLPAVTGGVLLANLALEFVDPLGTADWISIGLIVASLAVLGVAVVRTPQPDQPEQAGTT